MLLGSCADQVCLVYEYMADGILEDHFFQKVSTPPLSGFVHFRISWEVAYGLFFLHPSKLNPLVHEDLKLANILLDKNFAIKIGVVGLAKVSPPIVT